MDAQTAAAPGSTSDGVTAKRVCDSWISPTIVACALAIYVARCVQFDFIADDAFISFRYARNVSHGLGFVFNPGERVEGYTNFLMVVLLAVLDQLGADLVSAGRLISVAGGMAMIILTAALGRRAIPEIPWAGAATALLVAVNPSVAAWGGAGLETTLFGALVLAAMLPVTGGQVTAKRFVIASTAALFAALTRPEGVAVYALITFAILIQADRRRRSISALVPGVVCFLIVGGTYFLWRWSYFGALLPNTYAAKAPFSIAHLAQGAFYVLAFALNLPVAFALPFVLPGMLKLRKEAAAAVVVCAGLIIIVIAEGGDGLSIYRFLVPIVPLLLIAFVAYATTLRPKSGNPSAVLIIPVLVLFVQFVLSFLPSHDWQHLLYQYQRDYQIPRWREAGVALRRALPDNALIAAVPIGAIGWYSGLPVLDMLGLTDPVIAKAPVDPAIRWAGHEKHDGHYVLQRRPDALLLGNVFVSDSENPPTVPLSAVNGASLAWEGDIIKRPEFEREYRLAVLPLDNGLYLHYYLRRDIVPTPR